MEIGGRLPSPFATIQAPKGACLFGFSVFDETAQTEVWLVQTTSISLCEMPPSIVYSEAPEGFATSVEAQLLKPNTSYRLTGWGNGWAASARFADYGDGVIEHR